LYDSRLRLLVLLLKEKLMFGSVDFWIAYNFIFIYWNAFTFSLSQSLFNMFCAVLHTVIFCFFVNELEKKSK